VVSRGLCKLGTALSPTPARLTLKGASRKCAGIAPSASVIVLPIDEREDSGDGGRARSAMAADARGETGECMVGGGLGHVAAERMEPLRDNLEESPSECNAGTARVSVISLLGGYVNGA
jgi:hypothetical protein